jgi:hypothetical protein
MRPAAGGAAAEGAQPVAEFYGAAVEARRREGEARAAPDPDVVTEVVDEEERRRPAWRKVVGKVFPGVV